MNSDLSTFSEAYTCFPSPPKGSKSVETLSSDPTIEHLSAKLKAVQKEVALFKKDPSATISQHREIEADLEEICETLLKSLNTDENSDAFKVGFVRLKKRLCAVWEDFDGCEKPRSSYNYSSILAFRYM